MSNTVPSSSQTIIVFTAIILFCLWAFHEIGHLSGGSVSIPHRGIFIGSSRYSPDSLTFIQFVIQVLKWPFRKFTKMCKYRPINKFSKERAKILADIIEKQKHGKVSGSSTDGFSMLRPSHPCGSPACIAGYAGQLLGADPQFWSCSHIRDFLGCSDDDATMLYFGEFSDKVSLSEVLPVEAASAIRQLIDKYN